MATIATGQKTIIDLQDGKSVTVYLSSDMPKTQIKDNSSGIITPNWATTNLHVIANVSINGMPASGGCAFTWQRREGAGAYVNLTTGEQTDTSVLTNDMLIVSQNKLDSSPSGLITYRVMVVYTDPDTSIATTVYSDISFSLVSTGAEPHGVTLSGDQVFSYKGDTFVPTTLALTAERENVNLVHWEYWDYDSSTEPGYVTITGQAGDNLTVAPDGPMWGSEGSGFEDIAKIRVVCSATISGQPTNFYDVISLYKVHDGGPGDSAPIAFLTNEMVTFSGDADGVVPANISFSCNIVAYNGATKTTPQIVASAISECKIVDADKNADIDVIVGQTASQEIPLTIKTNKSTNLGGSGEQHGQIKIPLQAPVSTTLYISWGKVNTGEKGDSAVVMSVFAPNGATFLNQEGTKRIEVSAYDGATNIVTQSPAVATYQWYKYDATQQPPWVTISGAQDFYYDVSGNSVDSLASFKCIMAYGGVNYSDIIDVIDKTDPYQAEIESTGGDKFKNTQGTSFLSCRIWQGANEVDGLKTVIFSSVNPPTSDAAAAASVGSFCYYCPVSNYTGTWSAKQTVLLKKGSGGTWSAASSSECNTKTYTWTRRDKNGEAISGTFAVGKVIYIDGQDVDDKDTFVCTVSDEAVS